MGTEELRAFYDNELMPSLTGLELKRKEIVKKSMIAGAIFLLAALVFLGQNIIANSIGISADTSSIIGLGIFVGFVVVMIQVIRKRKLYRKEYKSDVVKKVIAGFDPSWEYHPYSKVDENHYRTSRLHSTHFDRYRGEDMIKGSIEKTDFEFSELHLTREETHTDSEGKVEKKTVTVFKGIFAHMDFNKEIKSNTFVSPDAGKALGKLGRWIENLNVTGDLVKLENPEFEKEYSVYGSDQIESRYVITPAMMEAMLTIKKKYKRRTKFSFIGSRVYMAMDESRNMFEPKIFRSIRFKDIELMAAQVDLIQIIIREMNLNTRIWTKD